MYCIMSSSVCALMGRATQEPEQTVRGDLEKSQYECQTKPFEADKTQWPQSFQDKLTSNTVSQSKQAHHVSAYRYVTL